MANQGMLQGNGTIGVGQDAVPPVAILLVKLVQAIQGGAGGSFHVESFVLIVVDGEAVMQGRQGGQLPNAASVTLAIVATHPAEGQRQILQLQGHVTLYQGGVDHGGIGREIVGEGLVGKEVDRPFQTFMIGQGNGLFPFFQPFDDLVAVRRHATIVHRKAENASPYYE